MKPLTFHYLVEIVRASGNGDLREELGLDPELDPAAYFLQKRTGPTAKMVSDLVEAYDKNGWKVKPPGATEAMDIRRAVEFMGDRIGAPVPQEGNRGRGRPPVSSIKDLRPLRDILRKYGYTQRMLALKADCGATVLTLHMNHEARITPQRMEQILDGAQQLFAGNPEALRELRKMEKNL